jgi:hypothetical protein
MTVSKTPRCHAGGVPAATPSGVEGMADMNPVVARLRRLPPATVRHASGVVNYLACRAIFGSSVNSLCAALNLHFPPV